MAEDRALYPELLITVQKDGTVRAELPGTGEKQEDGKINDDKLLLTTLKSFRDWLNQGRLNITLEREFEVLGRLLRRLLLEGSGGSGVRDLIDTKLADARSQGRRICVQLEFQSDQAELHSLPWEFLYDPKGKCFFATNNHLVLTRFIPSGKARQVLSSDELPLRMQVVVSRPTGQKSVAAEPSIAAIKEFAKANPNRIVLEETIEGLPFHQMQDRFKELKKEGKEPHLVHFIGHGHYNKSKRQGEVALPNAANDGTLWIDQNQFTRLFADVNAVPRLLFLQLCEGAVVEEAELIASFEGIAPELLGAGVQAVVAMQFPIKNLHASAICKVFYDELTKGESVGRAVQTARLKMVIDSPVAAGTPVLYMFGFDHAIVSAPSTPSAATSIGAHTDLYTGAVAGRSAAPASAQIVSTAAKETLSISTVTGGQPVQLNKIVDAAVKKIAEMRKGVSTIQGIQAKEASDESMSLLKKLYGQVVPKLQGKSNVDMNMVLADLCDREQNAQMRELLDTMFSASVTVP
jgi:hypothetical protein